MKKIISLLIVASFVLSLAAISVVRAEDSANATSTPKLKRIPSPEPIAATSTLSLERTATAPNPERATTTLGHKEAMPEPKLEKILSPEYIKYFNIIKKVDNALFGTRKATSTLPVTSSLEKNPVQENHPILEKIEHPGLISQFEKIQKIGTALWGIKKKATSTPFIIAPEVADCVAKAIDVKDKALMERVTTAAAELNVALSARSTCQQSALTASSTPREILNSCVKTFNEAYKKIKETSQKSQAEFWHAYNDSLKACHEAASSTPAVPMIEDGGGIF